MNETELITKLTTSVEVLSTRMTFLETTLTELRSDVRTLTDKPGKKWETIMMDLAKVLLAAFVGFAVSQIIGV